MQNPEDAALLMATEEYQEKVTTSPFLYLTLDLPTTPLFQVSLWHCTCGSSVAEIHGVVSEFADYYGYP